VDSTEREKSTHREEKKRVLWKLFASKMQEET
jgi:hypothetical protein